MGVQLNWPLLEIVAPTGAPDRLKVRVLPKSTSVAVAVKLPAGEMKLTLVSPPLRGVAR